MLSAVIAARISGLETMVALNATAAPASAALMMSSCATKSGEIMPGAAVKSQPAVPVSDRPA